MIETKKLQVNCNAEEDTTRMMQSFGWNLLSSQEINTHNNYLSSAGDSVYQHTEHINYVNLVFNRDTKMPHYDELCDLQRKWDALKYVPEKKLLNFNLFWLLLLPIFIIVNGKRKKYNKEVVAPENAKITRQLNDLEAAGRALL